MREDEFINRAWINEFLEPHEWVGCFYLPSWRVEEMSEKDKAELRSRRPISLVKAIKDGE